MNQDVYNIIETPTISPNTLFEPLVNLLEVQTCLALPGVDFLTNNHCIYIPYSWKYSRDPIFAERQYAKISLCNFRGWTFQIERVCV